MASRVAPSAIEFDRGGLPPQPALPRRAPPVGSGQTAAGRLFHQRLLAVAHRLRVIGSEIAEAEGLPFNTTEAEQ